MRHRTLLLIAAVVCFALDAVLIATDSTSVKAEAILLPLGLTFGFGSFLP